MLRTQYTSLAGALEGIRGCASSCFIEPVAKPPGFKAHVFFFAIAPRTSDPWGEWASAVMDSIRWSPDWQLEEHLTEEFDLVHCTKTFPATGTIEELGDELDNIIMDRYMVKGCRITTLGKLCRMAALAILDETDRRAARTREREFEEFCDHMTHCNACREEHLSIMLRIRLRAALAKAETHRTDRLVR